VGNSLVFPACPDQPGPLVIACLPTELTGLPGQPNDSSNVTTGQAVDWPSDRPAAIAQAAVAGRIATLLVEAQRFEPGWLDRSTGAIHAEGDPPVDLSRSGNSPAIRTEDLLGAIAETVLLHGGEIVSLEATRMPSETGLAAIYRY
jgi:hypothetical protein